MTSPRLLEAENKKLRVEIRALRAERDLLRTCPVCGKLETDGLEACSECYGHHFAASAERNRLRAALLRYGHHDYDCASPCTCGLDAARQGDYRARKRGSDG